MIWTHCNPIRRRANQHSLLALLLVVSILPALQSSARAEKRAWVGLIVGDILPSEVLFKFGWSAGVEVIYVYADSPASLVGIGDGDIVVEVDGYPVDNANTFVCLIAVRAPGTTVRITTIRTGKRQYMSMPLVPWPDFILTDRRYCPIHLG
jgi:S1-C subfamily serine protease